MKRFRTIATFLVALAGTVLTPRPGSATVQEPYTFCAKIGDWYDTDRTGYHVIYCENDIFGYVDYIYIKHGTPFRIENVNMS